MNTQAGEPRIAVLYPDNPSSYEFIYQRIIDGITSRLENPITRIAISKDTTSAGITKSLRDQDIRIVITIGQNSLLLASGLNRDIKVVAGGIQSTPDNMQLWAALSLTPDPSLIFTQAKTILPTAKRIAVVYNDQTTGWLIRQAQEAAANHGLSLVALNADNLKTALFMYQDFFSKANSKYDILWLPQDKITVNSDIVLPMVLLESWSRRIAVISNNPSHVKSGALFALYPNSYAMGQLLADLAISGSASKSGLLPLKAAYMTINNRTANHLGLSFTPQQQAITQIQFP